ncbi:lipoprotein [[Acholeplasma] multilocale]|uniref:lipoprotein n=1 Tax=[Acholeplasma] multilocale TaxID=264638 RepID=UPI00047C0EB6|nr:lipoprotein [[Acholeplasma] multilocale]
MKKLLAILGAVGLTATAGLAVVACSDSSDKDFKKVQSWIEDTKVQYKDGKVTKKGSSMVLYIGAKDNNSSLSFESAIKEFVGAGSDLQTNLDVLSKITNPNEGTTKTTKAWSDIYTGWSSQLGNPSTPNQEIAWNQTNEVKWNKDKSLWQLSDTSQEGKYIGYNTEVEAMDTNVNFKALTIKEIADLFKSGSTKSLLSDYVKKTVAQTLYTSNQASAGDVKAKEITEQVDAIVNKLSSKTGPMFLIIKNGVLTGMVNGFETFMEFNKNTDKSIDGQKGISKEEAKAIREESLITLFKNIAKEFNGSIVDSIVNGQRINLTVNSDQSDNETGTTYKWQTWDKGVTNDEDDASSETPNEPEEETEEESTDTYSFKNISDKYL